MADACNSYERIGLNFEINVYREGRRLYPGNTAILSGLAIALSASQRHHEALTVLDELLSAEPGKPTHLYNRACALCRVGRLEEALDELANAVDHGFDDFEHMTRDPDLRPLRTRPQFREYRQRALAKYARRVDREV